MISLAGRDILHGWGKFVFTGMGLGLLFGVTLVMAGVYRGMVADGEALLANTGADLWVVQRDTLGPYAEPSSLPGDTWRSVRLVPGVAEAAGATYSTMQLRQGRREVRAMLVGLAPGEPGRTPGWPPQLVAGRQLTRGHYEAVADLATGFRLGEAITLRGERYTVVGLTRRMVSASGDPMVFVPLKDAQAAQFRADGDAIRRGRRAAEADPAQNRPGNPAALQAALAAQGDGDTVNAVLVRLAPGADPDAAAESIRRWQRLTVYTREQMQDILVGKLIATSARQIGLFLVFLAAVCAAIVAFIIYTLTMDKIREIAVLKLLGTKNRSIAGMILQQALALGSIGFVVGTISASFSAPIFPKYVLVLPTDIATGLAAVLGLCTLASVAAIRAALAVDPAEAIGG
ncbi:MAG: ABC transporter permease [Gammaproteobacteria bacterium]|nr:ABC transporter permease [Gammaproteobacteria bacterium]